ARSLWCAAHGFQNPTVRVAPESSPTVRLDHGVFDCLLPISRDELALGTGRMRASSPPFAAASRAWRQNISDTQSTAKRRLCLSRAAAVFLQSRCRHRARTDFLSQRREEVIHKIDILWRVIRLRPRC